MEIQYVLYMFSFIPILSIFLSPVVLVPVKKKKTKKTFSSIFLGKISGDTLGKVFLNLIVHLIDSMDP